MGEERGHSLINSQKDTNQGQRPTVLARSVTGNTSQNWPSIADEPRSAAYMAEVKGGQSGLGTLMYDPASQLSEKCMDNVWLFLCLD